MTKQRLEAIIQELSAIFNELTRLEGTRTRNRLYPPASEKDIRAFEARHQPLPPSYREFLRVHNGWEDYRRVFTLIGVSGAHTSRALEAIEESKRIFLLKWAMKKRPTDPAYIAKYESKGRKNAKTLESARVFLPNRLIFGTDFTGGLYFFNPVPGTKGKEMEVLDRDQKFRIRERHRDFHAMLLAKLKMYRGIIANMRARR